MYCRAGFVAFVVAASFALAACTSLQGYPKPPDTSTVSAPTPGYQLGPAAILQYNAETDPTKKKLIRNEIIDARLAELDKKFGEFERELYAEGIGAGVGTDWALLAFTAASTLSTVQTTKTIFSAISTAVAGGAAAFDKRALFDKTLPALLAQMVAQRETARTSIRTSEQLPVESYSWFAAESDLQAFGSAGSIPGAIAGVAQDAGQKTAVAKQELKELTKAIYGKTATSAALRDFWKPDGKVDPANAAKLTSWLGQNGFAADAGSITMFIYDSTKEESRVKAVKDLGLR